MKQHGFLGLTSTAIVALLSACAAPPGDTSATDDALVGGSDLAIAADLPEQCAGPEIFRVVRPVDSRSRAKGRFAYGYRYKAPTVAGAPVLVYLPGGPGSSSTQAPPALLPEGWGYLLTDPRGVGCNTLASLPEGEVARSFFRSKEIAGDVIAAIEERGLENYVVMGLSYGTLLATHVAHGLEAKKAPEPRAVVLEGVLGKSFDGTFAGAEYIAQWDSVRSTLPADVLAELDGSDAPYGIAPDAWARALMALLMAGPKVPATVLSRLSATVEQPPGAKEAMIGHLRTAGAEQARPAGAVELYRYVACREIVDTTPQSQLDVIFVRGKLVRNAAAEGDMCSGLRFASKFDSAELQYRAKTYYFIGERDVATPAWQGAYHFDHNRDNAVRILTKDAGHNPLQHDQGACAPQVMKSIAAGGADLEAVLATCPEKVRVDAK